MQQLLGVFGLCPVQPAFSDGRNLCSAARRSAHFDEPAILDGAKQRERTSPSSPIMFHRSAVSSSALDHELFLIAQKFVCRNAQA
jgi:hypothetical protein